MRSIVLSQRKERDGLLEKAYLLRDYQMERQPYLYNNIEVKELN